MELDIMEKLALWREKAKAGELSLPEMREAITHLRNQRLVATTTAQKKGTSKKVISSEALLDELEGL